eukprot:456595_1
MGNVFCKRQDDSDIDSINLSSKQIEFGNISFDSFDNRNDSGKHITKICKVVVLGDECSCKSKLIHEYTDDGMLKQLEINNITYNISVWDVPNNNIFDICDMTHIYCQNAMAAIIVIDVTNPNALDNAYKLISSVKLTNKNIPIVILANKWNSTLRLFNENQMESFCIGIQNFISWEKINRKYDGSIEQRMVIEQMIEKISDLNNNN